MMTEPVPTHPTPSVPRGHQPAASPVARWLTIVVALALIAVAVIAGRELLIRNTSIANWEPLADDFTGWIGHMTWQVWMFPAGIIGIVVGLILLYLAFRPRTKTHERLDDLDVSLWMRPLDIARMCTGHARRIPGVFDAKTKVSKGNRVTVFITGDVDDPTLTDRVLRTVNPLVRQVVGAPDPVVDITPKGQ